METIALNEEDNAWQYIEWRAGTNDMLGGSSTAVRVRAAHRDHTRGTLRPEQWLFVDWPEEEGKPTRYRYHLQSWWEQRHNEDVLLLCYEDMRADLAGTVRRIARFMGIHLDDALLVKIVRQSSREFMLAHSHQFDEKPMRDIGGKRAGLPHPVNSSKVTRGASDDPRYNPSPELEDMLANIWHEQMASQFGFET